MSKNISLNSGVVYKPFKGLYLLLLSDYFTSLGIPASKLADWNRNVKPLIQPLQGELVINPLVLK